MPLAESTYSTYAPTADTAGFIASRDHRAMSGHSQGAGATWVAFGHLLDTARWWLPLSGASKMDAIKEAIDSQPEYKNDFFVYIGTGGPRDIAYEGVVDLAKQAIAAPEYFSFGQDMKANNFYVTISTEVHQTLIGRYYLYNAFDIMFKD